MESRFLLNTLLDITSITTKWRNLPGASPKLLLLGWGFLFLSALSLETRPQAEWGKSMVQTNSSRVPRPSGVDTHKPPKLNLGYLIRCESSFWTARVHFLDEIPPVAAVDLAP